MSDKDKQSPSLLEAESKGGDTATKGLDFQANLILCKIPYLLSYEGFSSIIWESIGDIEAKFYVPGIGQIIEVIEAKDHQVTPSEFWEEIERFQRMDEGSPGTYNRFILSCPGLSKALQPLVNGLKRLRDPYPFYDFSSGVFQNSYNDFKKIIKKLDKDDKTAKFIYNKFIIEDKWGSLSDKSKGIFKDEFYNYLPDYDLRSSELDKVFEKLLVLVRSKKNKPVSRCRLTETINNSISNDSIPSKPVYIYTSVDEVLGKSKELRFTWHPFFGDYDRKYPPTSEWNTKLFQELIETNKWIQANRSTKKIHLSGNRRISASLAIGVAFSAVSGFVIEAEQRNGEVWSTDSFPDKDTPEYKFSVDFEEKTGEELILTIGITRDSIATEVTEYLHKQNLLHLPKLHLFSHLPILSAQQANVVVNKIKNEIKMALSITKAKQIHLFYAGPSHLALFLGHRWNALASLQCYEWIKTGEYMPTCYL